jgi:excisionase family DNA binding protein
VSDRGEKVVAEGWITTAQAVELTGYHVEYLRELLRQGEVEAVKLTPRAWLVNKESLLAYKARVRMGRPPKGAGDD